MHLFRQSCPVDSGGRTLIHHRGNIYRDCSDVRFRKHRQVVAYTAHRTGRRTVIDVNSRVQVIVERIDSPRFGGRARDVDRWGVPSFGHATGKRMGASFAAGKIAWRMASTAVAQAFHQIGASVPFFTASWYGNESTLVQE